MFTPTLRCECAQPGLIDTMRKWSISLYTFLNKKFSNKREKINLFTNYVFKLSNHGKGTCEGTDTLFM